MSEPRELILLSRARQAISEATTLDEVKDIRDKAAAVTAYIKKAQMGQKLVVDAAAIKLRAERRLGELLQTIDLADSSPGNQYTGKRQAAADEEQPILLRNLGISKSDSSRSQRLAALPSDIFEQYIAENMKAQREPTIAGLLRLARALLPRAPKSREREARVNGHSLTALIDAGRGFPTVYADPPWPTDSDGDAAWQRTVKAIGGEPVPRVCEDNAHLHLWATTASLPYAFKIIEVWGFTYRSCLVCLDTTIRGTKYWRDAQQFLLLAIRGDLPFSGPDQAGWINLEWPGDGRKPDAICDLIEAVSPGPYLDMYGTVRRPTDSWVSLPGPFARDVTEAVDHTDFHTDRSTEA